VIDAIQRRFRYRCTRVKRPRRMPLASCIPVIWSMGTSIAARWKNLTNPGSFRTPVTKQMRKEMASITSTRYFFYFTVDYTDAIDILW